MLKHIALTVIAFILTLYRFHLFIKTLFLTNFEKAICYNKKMIKFKTNLSKFPKEMLNESEQLLKDNKYEITVSTDHGLTVNFNDGGKEITTSLVFNTDGNLINYSCNCNKYSLCKHVGAVLKIIDNNKNNVVKRDLNITILSKEFSYESKYFHTDSLFIDFMKTLVRNFSKESIVDTFFYLYTRITYQNNGYFLYKFFTVLSKQNLPSIFHEILKETIIKIVDFMNTLNTLNPKLNDYLTNLFTDICLEVSGNEVLAELYFSYLNSDTSIYAPIYNYLALLVNNIPLNVNNLSLKMIDKLATYDNSYYRIGSLPLALKRYFITTIYKNTTEVEKYLLKLCTCYSSFLSNELEMLEEVFAIVVNEYSDLNSGETLLTKIININSSCLTKCLKSISSANRNYYSKVIIDKLGIYNYYPISQTLDYADKLEKANTPISLKEIVNLINSNYNFYLHNSFFSNKEIVKSKEHENFSDDELSRTLTAILNKIHSTTLQNKLSYLIKTDIDILNSIKSNFEIKHSATYAKLNLLEDLGFHKI